MHTRRWMSAQDAGRSRAVALLAVAGLICTLGCGDALAVKLPAPPKIADLAGTWVGPDESGAVLRLTVDNKGVGLLEVRQRGHRASERFQLMLYGNADSYRLTFATLLDPAAPRALTLSGSFMPGG